MELSDVLFVILYGGAFFFVLYFIAGFFYKPAPSTVVVYDEVPVYYNTPVWPWYGGYNWWPSWFPLSAGYAGGYGGYYGRKWSGPGKWEGGIRHAAGARPWGHSGSRSGYGGAYSGARTGGHTMGGHGGAR